MSLNLEDFSTLLEHPDLSHKRTSSKDLESAKTAAYEQGYAAGWDDAAKAEAESQTRIGSEFARHLQEMSFTFHEARAHVIEATKPVLQELVETILPKVIRETMGARIVETLDPLIDQAADQPITITVAQGCRELLEPYLENSVSAVLELVEEPTLTDGQAYLRLGQVERKIDLTDALNQVLQALSALSNLNEEVLKHG